MVEKFSEQLKKSFSNGPKAKILLGLVVSACILTGTIITMRKTVNISIDGKDESIVTYKGTVKDVLADNGIEIDPKDKVEPSLESKVSENEKITVKTAIPVKVVIAGQEHEVKTAEDTIADMLAVDGEELGYKEEDIVEPSVETAIRRDMSDVKITQVEIETVVENEVMPFNTVEKEDNDRDVSLDPLVTQEGVNGEKEVTYQIVKHDGEIVKKEAISQKTIKETQDKVVVKGTALYMASRSGGNQKVKKKITVTATAYSGGGLTATGRKPVRNVNGISTIAVDPRVIPLGSLVEVQGYGKAIASDTGGAIKGNIIDVYLNSDSECRSWGRKHGLTLGIIAYPGEW